MEKQKKYTYTDYLELKQAGYRGIELIDGVPYQYGVSFSEQEPVRFSPDIIEKILTNFFTRFEESLKNTPYQVFLAKAISINETVIIPDLAIMKDNESIVLIVEVAESEKQDRLRWYEEAIIEYWLLYPESQSIGVNSKNEVDIYSNDNRIPIVATGIMFDVVDVWEPPI